LAAYRTEPLLLNLFVILGCVVYINHHRSHRNKSLYWVPYHSNFQLKLKNDSQFIPIEQFPIPPSPIPIRQINRDIGKNFSAGSMPVLSTNCVSTLMKATKWVDSKWQRSNIATKYCSMWNFTSRTVCNHL